MSWQPSITPEMLLRRAQTLASIRSFFAAQGVLEVEVPALGTRTVTDPFLAPLTCTHRSRALFLQTSPEFYMKRLLASGSGCIYSLGKAFRLEQPSPRHRLEFTLLEWYRVAFDDRQLMDDVSALFQQLQPHILPERRSYRSLFEHYLGVDPHQVSDRELAAVARRHVDVHWDQEDRTTWLDLLFSHVIEPKLQTLTFVYDYPACQCALARVVPDENGVPVARRFEVFYKGLEIANAYWELCDAKVQRQRFDADLAMRQARDLPLPEVDDQLLAALDAGLPECAGIALGVERLLMALYDVDDIARVTSFAST